MSSSQSEALGWDFYFQQQLSSQEQSALVPARVMNVHKSGLHIVAPGLDCQVAQIDDENRRATVGDWLLFDPQKQRAVRCLARKSLFKRIAPGTERREQLIAANVDTVFIVSSCNQDFNEARLERYLAIAREAGVMAVVVLTKADLCEDPAAFIQRAAGLAPAIVVEAVNALAIDSLDCLQSWLGKGQTIALLGSSGVGKTTLSNTLMGLPLIRGEHGAGGLATAAIREDDARGRHTTTSRSLHLLPGGAWLMDTPGMRELQISDVKAGLEDVFAEISVLVRQCRFSDCEHQEEPGCAVQAALDAGTIDEDRLKRWRKLAREEAHNSATIAEKREQGRKFGRMYKDAINAKKLQNRN